MTSNPAPALLQTGNRILLIDGPVLELFNGSSSAGRTLLMGASASLTVQDRKGRSDLEVANAAGQVVLGHRIEAPERDRAERFLVALQAAIAVAAR